MSFVWSRSNSVTGIPSESRTSRVQLAGLPADSPGVSIRSVRPSAEALVPSAPGASGAMPCIVFPCICIPCIDSPEFMLCPLVESPSPDIDMPSMPPFESPE